MKKKIKSLCALFLSLILFLSNACVCYGATPNVPKTFYVAVGGTLTIPTDLSSCQGKTKKWASNSDVIHITSNGSVKGLKEGSATAYCTTNASEIGITNVVVVPAAKLLINKAEATMGKKSTLKLSCSVNPSNAIKTVFWSSSNTAIASVDENGIVSSKSRNGTCIITCTASDGTNNSVSCKVTVHTAESTTKKKETTPKKPKPNTTSKPKAPVVSKPTTTKNTTVHTTRKWAETTKSVSEDTEKNTTTETTTEITTETTTKKKEVKRVVVTDENSDEEISLDFEVAEESDYQLLAVSKKNCPIIIQWNEIENVDGYELYCADQSMQFNAIYCGKNNSYSKHYFENGKHYFFSVRGYRYVNNKKVYIDSSEIIHIQAVKASLFK